MKLQDRYLYGLLLLTLVAITFLSAATINDALCEILVTLSAIVLSPLIVAFVAVSPRLIRCLLALVIFKLGYAERARELMGPWNSK